MTRTLYNGRTAKIGFDPICYGTAATAQRQLERQRETATAERQRNGGNQGSQCTYAVLSHTAGCSASRYIEAFDCDELDWTGESTADGGLEVLGQQRHGRNSVTYFVNVVNYSN